MSSASEAPARAPLYAFLMPGARFPNGSLAPVRPTLSSARVGYGPRASSRSWGMELIHLLGLLFGLVLGLATLLRAAVRLISGRRPLRARRLFRL